jgi:hypothetical protein
MDDAVRVWGTVVHVLAFDHGRKPKAISGPSLVCGGWLGALVASDTYGVRGYSQFAGFGSSGE